MSDQLYCPECADKWSGAYNTDHRCVTCGSPLKAEAGDGELARLRETARLAERFAKSKGRYHSQSAMCDLLEHFGLPCERPRGKS